jgi:hypothetical protein
MTLYYRLLYLLRVRGDGLGSNCLCCKAAWYLDLVGVTIHSKGSKKEEGDRTSENRLFYLTCPPKIAPDVKLGSKGKNLIRRRVHDTKKVFTGTNYPTTQRS